MYILLVFTFCFLPVRGTKGKKEGGGEPSNLLALQEYLAFSSGCLIKLKNKVQDLFSSFLLILEGSEKLMLKGSILFQ